MAELSFCLIQYYPIWQENLDLSSEDKKNAAKDSGFWKLKKIKCTPVPLGPQTLKWI